MKKIIILITLVIGLSQQAYSQTPISKDIANSYFKNCVKKSDPRMKQDTISAFCACTSAKYMESMSLEEVNAMYANTADAKIMQNKLLIEVYGPCISLPVQDYVTGSCLENPQFKSLNLQNPTHEELCQCISKSTGQWLSVRGRLLMKELLHNDPNMIDPITPVMDSQEFKNESYKHMTNCMAK